MGHAEPAPTCEQNLQADSFQLSVCSIPLPVSDGSFELGPRWCYTKILTAGLGLGPGALQTPADGGHQRLFLSLMRAVKGYFPAVMF